LKIDPAKIFEPTVQVIEPSENVVAVPLPVNATAVPSHARSVISITVPDAMGTKFIKRKKLDVRSNSITARSPACRVVASKPEYEDDESLKRLGA
jgi:hypothetical protein